MKTCENALGLISHPSHICREFAEVVAAISGDAGRVVAVTSAEKAKAALDAKPGFWDVKKVL